MSKINPFSYNTHVSHRTILSIEMETDVRYHWRTLDLLNTCASIIIERPSHLPLVNTEAETFRWQNSFRFLPIVLDASSRSLFTLVTFASNSDGRLGESISARRGGQNEIDNGAQSIREAGSREYRFSSREIQPANIPADDIIFRKWLTFSRWTPLQVAALSLPARSTRCNLLPPRGVMSCLLEDEDVPLALGRSASAVSCERSTVSRAWLRLLLGFWSVEAVFLVFVPSSTYDINDPRVRTTWCVNPKRDTDRIIGEKRRIVDNETYQFVSIRTITWHIGWISLLK